MKSLQESLFDKDLAQQSISLEPNFIWEDLIFKEIYCALHNVCVNAGWLMDMNDDTLKVHKSFPYGPKQLQTKVQFIIYRGSDGYICAPKIRFVKQWAISRANFDISASDVRFSTKQCIVKGFKFADGRFDEKYFLFEGSTAMKIIEFLKNLIKKLISTEFSKLIQKQIDQFEDKEKPVPGVVLDQSILKKLIKEA